jgi:glucan-binding YG repeat protein
MKKQTKLAAILSAAAFMSMVPAFSTIGGTGTAYAASYGWTDEDGTSVYYDEDGYLTTDSWRKNGDYWYYLNEDGQISKNMKIDDYYVGSDGKMVTNTWMELLNEEDMDSPESPASFWYYFGKDGKAAISQWVKLNSKWYYFDESGHMLTGKVVIGGSTYYLGGEKDGSMKTGWVKLEENSSTPGASENWYYFNSDGKMVETQYDKKIGGSYYTFIDGKMQTGWVKMPELSETAVSASSDSDSASDTVTNYQYYGAAGDGKRAEGWHTTEGIEGIHDVDETFTFYFKSGKAFASSKKGNELFTISTKRYAFNERGEMQTGRQIVNIENDEIANFYFGDDGVMKTGKQSIYNETTGETENWFFHTDGDRKGQGYHGIRDNVLYVYGKRQEASAAERYAAAELNGTLYLVNTTGTVQKASASSTSSEKAELGRGFKDFKDANGKVWIVDVNGVIQ